MPKQKGGTMSDINKPRRGSLAYRPRKRAERQMPEISFWPAVKEKALLDFPAYKAGMTSVSYVDKTKSPTGGMEVTLGATVLEAPPIVVYGVRGYSSNRTYDLFTDNKEILKFIAPKSGVAKSSMKEGAEFEDVRVLAFAQPSKTLMGKKHIERMEIGVGGETAKDKLEYAKTLLGKEVHVLDVLKPGQYVDIAAITKGKGWQGVIKRFHAAKQRLKATGKVRHTAPIGSFKPGYVMYTMPRAGQMGYHKRIELSKWIVKIADSGAVDQINPSSGFPHYGFIKNDYILIKGSVAGPTRRMVRLRYAMRNPNVVQSNVTYISKEPKN
jgi:large subunit ribosomal protein L3